MEFFDDDDGDVLPGKRPTNANRRWSESEEAELRQYFERGTSVADLAVVHGRTAHAIRMRLIKLGLIDEHDTSQASRDMAVPKPMTPRVERPEATTKLTIELVPQSCWFSNVRSEVSAEEWDKVRRPVSKRANYRCEICGGAGGTGTKRAVECHEVWHYDDARLVQTLVRMIALCPACHEVKHIGRSTAHGRRDEAEAHLAKVNGWTPEVTRKYVDQAFVMWEKRSAKPWSLDISVLADYGVTPPVRHDRQTVPAVPTQPALPAAAVVESPAVSQPAPKRRRSNLPMLADIVFHLPCGGRQPRVPLLARTIDPLSPLRWLAITPLAGRRSRQRPPQRLRHTPNRMVAAPPLDATSPHWEREGNWWFWWDGRQWTGDRKPASSRPAWWQDPYGPGLRWWTGLRWSQESLRMKEGWVPVRPGHHRVYLWWNGEAFEERLRPIAVGARVRPKDRKNVGKVVGVDRSAREQPALVYFRNKRTGRDATVNFSFSKLQRT